MKRLFLLAIAVLVVSLFFIADTEAGNTSLVPNSSAASDALPQVAPSRSSGSTGPVIVATVAGSINPVSADYLDSILDEAREKSASLVILELDTPGGLDQSMRQMVQSIIRSEIPVVVFVAPSGGRAASAGVLVTLAADVAAMAPGTNIGAAHPVPVGGGSMDNTMSAKVENDAASYARSLAERKGRNAEWSENAVRKSVSLTEVQALDQKVVDLISPDLNALLLILDGREVVKGGVSTTVKTKGVPIERIPMGFRHKVLAAIADPNIAYILMMIGVYGLFFEFSTPGAVLPGVLGGIFLLLGLWSLQALSASYAGLLLILLGVLMFFLEIKITSYGALGIGGTVAVFLGSLMLFRGSLDPFLRISWTVLFTMVAATAAFFGTLVTLAVKSQSRKPMGGFEGLMGEVGEVTADFAGGRGKVFVAGESWDAESSEPLKKGDPIRVIAWHGMKLKIERE